MATARRKRRKMVSEINVVPYIDVMLVLLIIFMVTAPLMNVGVDIQLPKANAKPLDNKEEPLVVSVAADGRMFMKEGQNTQQVDNETLARRAGALIAANPKLVVLVGGDTAVDYGRVYEVMGLLQQAGVQKVGLMGEPGTKIPPKAP